MGVRESEKCLDFRRSLKVKLIRFVKRFNVVKEKSIRDNFKIYGLNFRKR